MLDSNQRYSDKRCFLSICLVRQGQVGVHPVCWLLAFEFYAMCCLFSVHTSCLCFFSCFSGMTLSLPPFFFSLKLVPVSLIFLMLCAYLSYRSQELANACKYLVGVLSDCHISEDVSFYLNHFSSVTMLLFSFLRCIS